jgi:PIN domain nuclease of toxin-antitoxin system
MECIDMIVLDTHVWVWWLSDSHPLSPKVQKLITEAKAKQAIFISSISVWEVAQLATRGRLKLTMHYTDWIAQTESLSFINFVPVDNHIALRSVQLSPPLHQDPADRMIMATALTLGMPLITKDEKISRYPHLKTIW